MGNRFAAGKKAIAMCDRCGQRFLLHQLKEEIIKTKRYNLMVCDECWDPDHPQNWVGIIGGQKATNDPQALREPRPDNNRPDSCIDFAFNPVATQTVYTTLNNARLAGYSGVQPGVVIVPPNGKSSVGVGEDVLFSIAIEIAKQSDIVQGRELVDVLGCKTIIHAVGLTSV